MARLYANENVPRQIVEALRGRGHDVLTSRDAGRANRAVPDEEVLAFSTSENRVLLTLNRRHFLRLHQSRKTSHSGIVVLRFDPDFARQAERIDAALATERDMKDKLVRVNRPG